MERIGPLVQPGPHHGSISNEEAELVALLGASAFKNIKKGIENSTNNGKIQTIGVPPSTSLKNSLNEEGRDGRVTCDSADTAFATEPTVTGVLLCASCEPTCTICLDPTSTPDSRMLTCGHTFHNRCLADFSRSDPALAKMPCPQCRDPFVAWHDYEGEGKGFAQARKKLQEDSILRRRLALRHEDRTAKVLPIMSGASHDTESVPSMSPKQVWLRPERRELRLTEKDETKYKEKFTFVIAADTQIGFSDDLSWGGTDTEDYAADIATCKKLVDSVNALEPPPRFVTICGDLVHAMPPGLKGESEGGKASHTRYSNRKRWRRQNEVFREALSRLRVPLVCVCGNHDVGDRPTPEAISNYESLYGQDYFGMWCGGMRCLVLNSQLMNDPTNAPKEAAAQDAWLNTELEAFSSANQKNADKDGVSMDSGGRHLVVFQHIPWCLASEDEQSNYYCMAPSARDIWLGKLKEHGVSKVFSGHYHRNATCRTTDGKLEVVVTSAVGKQLSAEEVIVNKHIRGSVSDTKSGFRLCSVDQNHINHRYIEFGP